MTMLSVEIIKNKRPVKGKVGHMVQTGVCRLL